MYSNNINTSRKIKILLIEDDIAWGLYIESIIYGSKYELIGSANSKDQAIAMIDGLKPDLLVTDIRIQNQTIFDILKDEKYKILNILFMTSFLEPEYFTSAHDWPKSTYLVKPFHQFSLLAALDLLSSNHPNEIDSSTAFVTVRGLQQQLYKLKLDDVTWIHSEGNYSFINTVGGKKYAKKISLTKLSEELDSRFLFVHRGFAVNKDYIQRVELGKKSIYVQDKVIPIGRNFRGSLDNFLNSKN